MTERPIIFSGPMVRAILSGAKTQTRRVVKPQPLSGLGYMMGYARQYAIQVGEDWPDDARDRVTCPYGVPGDRLWVRESWTRVPQSAYWHDSSVPHCRDGEDWIIYRAGWERSNPGVGWHPSIHMPRWASRITLEVTDVRVERVQDISEADVIAEGITHHDGLDVGHSGFRYSTDSPVYATAKAAYAALWDKINRKRGYGLDVNPWAWVVEFERLEAAS